MGKSFNLYNNYNVLKIYSKDLSINKTEDPNRLILTYNKTQQPSTGYICEIILETIPNQSYFMDLDLELQTTKKKDHQQCKIDVIDAVDDKLLNRLSFNSIIAEKCIFIAESRKTIVKFWFENISCAKLIIKSLIISKNKFSEPDKCCITPNIRIVQFNYVGQSGRKKPQLPFAYTIWYLQREVCHNSATLWHYCGGQYVIT